MVEQDDDQLLRSGLDDYIEGSKKQAAVSRTAAENDERLVAFLLDQKELLDRYGRMPLAMQTRQFIIEQIAASAAGTAEVEVASSELSTEAVVGSGEADLGERVTSFRPRTRRPAASRREQQEGRSSDIYSIAPQVKPIMNGILAGGSEVMPVNLDELFDRMYPNQDWRSRTVYVPVGIGQAGQRISYGEDLASENSVIREMIRGADQVISTRMKGNADPTFTFRRKKAAPELVQIYRKIETVGWEAYDGFMMRNRIREF